ncbi:MAG TPA: glycosyl transferase, partial [Stellaceae bacterium]|nr:glycosyl transferase [Stellaceae bacterium]
MTGLALATALAAFIATFALTPRVLRWLEARAILDRPGHRSAHQVPVPRGGGLALVPVVLALWLGLALAGQAPA